jgi:hypothetical protein
MFCLMCGLSVQVLLTRSSAVKHVRRLVFMCSLTSVYVSKVTLIRSHRQPDNSEFSMRHSAMKAQHGWNGNPIQIKHVRLRSTGLDEHSCECLKTFLILKMRAFWDIAPCSRVGVDRRFRDAYCRHHQSDEFILTASIITLMMETVLTSETSVYSKETIQCYIPKGCHIHTRCSENLKSYLPNYYCLNIKLSFVNASLKT